MLSLRLRAAPSVPPTALVAAPSSQTYLPGWGRSFGTGPLALKGVSAWPPASRASRDPVPSRTHPLLQQSFTVQTARRV